MAFVCCSAQSGQNADKAPQSAETTGQLKAGQLAADHAPKAQDARTDDQMPTTDDPSTPEKKMAADKARLLKLAKELRDEIDKSAGSGTLSLNVIRKAEEIEKLAHSVKQEMNRN
jgi:hypothetical protein